VIFSGRVIPGWPPQNSSETYHLGTLAPLDFTPDTHAMPKEVDISIGAVFTNVFVFSPYLPSVHISGRGLSAKHLQIFIVL